MKRGTLRPPGYRLVAVVIGFVWAINGDVKIFGLSIGQSRELHVERSQVGSSDLLVQLLRKHAKEIIFVKQRYQAARTRVVTYCTPSGKSWLRVQRAICART